MMKKKRKKEKGEADLRWLLSLVALLVAVVPGGIVEVFLLLPCAKAQASIFPPPRLLFLFLFVSLPILWCLSLSTISSLSLLFHCFFFPSLCFVLFLPSLSLFLSFFLSLLFSSILIMPLNSQNNSPSIFHSSVNLPYFLLVLSSSFSVRPSSLFVSYLYSFPLFFLLFFLPYFFNSLLSLCFCSLFIQNPLSSCSVLFSLYFPPILSFFPTPLTLSLPWYL